MTPRQFEQWKEVSEANEDLIDGYDELSEDLQEKVIRCIEQEHVDDDEWNGVRFPGNTDTSVQR